MGAVKSNEYDDSEGAQLPKGQVLRAINMAEAGELVRGSVVYVQVIWGCVQPLVPMYEGVLEVPSIDVSRIVFGLRFLGEERRGIVLHFPIVCIGTELVQSLYVLYAERVNAIP